jgi:hypothetical protein
MIGLVKVLMGAGAALLAYSIFTPKKAYAGESGATSEGVKLKKGQSAVITVQLEPITAAQWAKIAKDPGQLASLAAALFPHTGPLTVDTFTPAPAPGIVTAGVTARMATTYRPSTTMSGPYTVTTIAARKA